MSNLNPLVRTLVVSKALKEWRLTVATEVLLSWREPEPFDCGPTTPWIRMLRVAEVILSLFKIAVFVACFAALLAHVLQDISQLIPNLLKDTILLLIILWLSWLLAKEADRLLRPIYQQYLPCCITTKGIRLRDTRFIKWKNIEAFEIFAEPTFHILKFTDRHGDGFIFFDPNEVNPDMLRTILAEHVGA